MVRVHEVVTLKQGGANTAVCTVQERHRRHKPREQWTSLARTHLVKDSMVHRRSIHQNKQQHKHCVFTVVMSNEQKALGGPGLFKPH